jgi:hypothetical protein
VIERKTQIHEYYILQNENLLTATEELKHFMRKIDFYHQEEKRRKEKRKM